MNLHKLPRLYLPVPLAESATVPLPSEQTHYLKNVLRKGQGDQVRTFNGMDGEWLVELQELGKKSGIGICKQLLTKQPPPPPRIHLLYAPIKKARMDFLIEKAVELGATDLHPVITEHTENRHLNEDRIRAQIIEAAEQCERLDIPQLHNPCPLTGKLSQWPNNITILAAIERHSATEISFIKFDNNHIAALIGPEGGFSADEITLLEKYIFIKAISLGSRILRSETAVCKILSHFS